jgi:hypothetical protein
VLRHFVRAELDALETADLRCGNRFFKPLTDTPIAPALNVLNMMILLIFPAEFQSLARFARIENRLSDD